jgi:hypothetical protein
VHFDLKNALLSKKVGVHVHADPHTDKKWGVRTPGPHGIAAHANGSLSSKRGFAHVQKSSNSVIRPYLLAEACHIFSKASVQHIFLTKK